MLSQLCRVSSTYTPVSIVTVSATFVPLPCLYFLARDIVRHRFCELGYEFSLSRCHLGLLDGKNGTYLPYYSTLWCRIYIPTGLTSWHDLYWCHFRVVYPGDVVLDLSYVDLVCPLFLVSLPGDRWLVFVPWLVLAILPIQYKSCLSS